MSTRCLTSFSLLGIFSLLVFQSGCGATDGTEASYEGIQPTEVTTATFEQLVVQSDKPVLIDCWAEWCGPCRQMTPIMHELAGEFDGKAVVAKLNVDENPEIAKQLGISGIPAFFLYKDGEVVESFVGTRSKSELAAAINSAL